MKDEQIIIAVAELGGWTGCQLSGNRLIGIHPFNRGQSLGSNGSYESLPTYLTSRDAIIPVIEKQAMEYVDSGNLQEAFASMASDVTKHPETSHHMSTNQLGMSMLMAGHLGTVQKMTDWIQGYN